MNKPDIDPKVAKFFEGLTAVIYEPNTSTRLSIRKVLTDQGLAGKNIFVAQSFEQIRRHINEQAPNLVFTVDEIGKHSGLELLADHLKAIPCRMNAGFFVISNYNSLVTAAEVSEYDIDYLLTKPFTQEGVGSSIRSVFKDKIVPGKFHALLEKGKEALYSGKYDQSLEYLQKTFEIKETIVANFYMGRVYKEMGDADQALVYFGKALAKKSDHYRSLLGCFDIHFERANFTDALRYARILLKKHPINPKRIIQYIKLSIATKSYMDIVYYCELLEDVNRDQTITKNIAAGLAVGAKFLSQNRSELKLARMCLQHASKYCAHFPLISISVAQSYIKIGESRNAEVILDNLKKTSDFENEETAILRIYICFKAGDYPKALVGSLNMIKTRVSDERLYEVAVRSAIVVGRRPDFVMDLYHDASKKFPALKRLESSVNEYCG